MSIVDLLMPKMGESIMEATILKWHKKVGDAVLKDETVADIATDKVDSELPSTVSGTVVEILYQENEVVPVGAVLLKVNTSADVVEGDILPVTDVINTPLKVAFVEAENNIIPKDTKKRFYSPAVLNIAAANNVSLSKLEQIQGSGEGGRVSKKDILKYINSVDSSKELPIADSALTTILDEKKDVSVGSVFPSYQSGSVEIIEMDRMRKLIADHMVKSKAIAPHVTSFIEVDVTNIVQWRNKVKAAFEKKYDEKITFTPIFMEAVVAVIKKFPMINSSVDGNNIILKYDINIGMATALPSGSLIVPVIKNADNKNLLGLTKKINQLAADARNNRLKPDDTRGGTFTLTNVGIFGSLMGTPIINQPQVAILAVGVIKKRPVVIETEQGDAIGIRHMMYLSLSYDHRIVDGSLGAGFLSELARQLENFDINREF